MIGDLFDGAFLVTAVSDNGEVATIVETGPDRMDFFEQIAELATLMPNATWTSVPVATTKTTEALHAGVQPR